MSPNGLHRFTNNQAVLGGRCPVSMGAGRTAYVNNVTRKFTDPAFVPPDFAASAGARFEINTGRNCIAGDGNYAKMLPDIIGPTAKLRTEQPSRFAILMSKQLRPQ